MYLYSECLFPQNGGKAVDKALELVGEWKVAFGQQGDYKAIIDVFFELEREGYHIPETQVSSYDKSFTRCVVYIVQASSSSPCLGSY